MADTVATPTGDQSVATINAARASAVAAGQNPYMGAGATTASVNNGAVATTGAQSGDYLLGQQKSPVSVVSTTTGKNALNTAVTQHNGDVAALSASNAPTPVDISKPTSKTLTPAATAAIQAQGGVTADEAASTGISTSTLASNYTYDTNTGYYIPKDQQTVQTNNNYQADTQKANSAFSAQIAGMDAATQALIQSINGIYDARIAAQQDVNNHELAGVNTMNIRGGTSRYAGGVAQSIFTADENAGLDRIKAIASEMTNKIAEANQNLQDKKYTAFMDNRAAIDKLTSERNAKLKDLQTTALEEQHRQEDAAKKVTDDINSVKLEAAKNGADAATLAKIGSTKTQSDAITAAGQFLETSSNTQITNYLQYKRDAIINGQTPQNYNDWKIKDDAQTIKEKGAEAYATAFATASGKAVGEVAASKITGSLIVPVTSTNGITYNVPSSVAPYVKISPSGVKYVDVSSLSAAEKGKIVKDAFNNGVNPIPVITDPTFALDVSNISDATLKLNDMKNTFDSITTDSAAKRDTYYAAAITMASKLQTDPNAVASDVYQDAALDVLKAMSGTKGFRGGASMVDAVKASFPNKTDTQQVVDQKIANMQKLLNDREVGLVGKPSASDQFIIDSANAEKTLIDYGNKNPSAQADIIAMETKPDPVLGRVMTHDEVVQYLKATGKLK